MSVQNDTLDIHNQPQRDDIPSLEYRSANHDSLSMFLAAIGGAILGVLLTLLILAIINGGTLDFTSNARVQAVEATVRRVNENVGTLSSNVDVIAVEMSRMRNQLATAESSLRAAVAAQEAQAQDVDQRMTGMDQALGELEQTRMRFDTFVGALTTALAEMETIDQP